MGERMKAAIHRWQERLRQRRMELLERRNIARTTLRDCKQTTGHEGGAPGGWHGRSPRDRMPTTGPAAQPARPDRGSAQQRSPSQAR